MEELLLDAGAVKGVAAGESELGRGGEGDVADGAGGRGGGVRRKALAGVGHARQIWGGSEAGTL